MTKIFDNFVDTKLPDGHTLQMVMNISVESPDSNNCTVVASCGSSSVMGIIPVPSDKNEINAFANEIKNVFAEALYLIYALKRELNINKKEEVIHG